MAFIHKIPSLRSAKDFLTTLSLFSYLLVALSLASFFSVAKLIGYNTKMEATLQVVY
jgi:hypothetical protein